MLGLALLIGVIGFFMITNAQMNKTQVVTLPPVFAEMQGDFAGVKRIRISVPEGSFQIMRQGENWVMPERGNFPVSSKAIGIFAADVKYLKILGQYSNDPSQFDILGVGESKEFGEGTTVELFDARDNIIAARHIATKASRVFVRKLGQAEVYSAQGHWPKIERKSAWLDFELLNITARDIEKVTIHPKTGAIFEIETNDDGSLTLNGHRSTNINALALAVADWQPIDVIDRYRISAPNIMSHQTTTKSGLVIKASLKRHFDVYWLVIDAETSENANEAIIQQAAAINARAAKWAFAISEPAADILKQRQSLLAMRGTSQ
ncbi:MAG: hypothetical protein FD163_455 [Hyphomonadaceae bacterium]|nr:MAG: hypothetical protein FD128_445 [Hyphomonadaceae bacterium]KAF0187180.1 MAG: hypothetical protein FD163_455 [Hyphomonadaceae bacterium]